MGSCGIGIDFSPETDRPGRWMIPGIEVCNTRAHTVTCLKQPFKLSNLLRSLKSVC